MGPRRTVEGEGGEGFNWGLSVQHMVLKGLVKLDGNNAGDGASISNIVVFRPCVSHKRMINAVAWRCVFEKESNMADEKRVTLTIRLTETEKREADTCASYLGLPLSTYFRFAARQLFNENRGKMVEMGLWPSSPGQPLTEPSRKSSNIGGDS